jgi:hypothetical protein
MLEASIAPASTTPAVTLLDRFMLVVLLFLASLWKTQRATKRSETLQPSSELLEHRLIPGTRWIGSRALAVVCQGA